MTDRLETIELRYNGARVGKVKPQLLEDILNRASYKQRPGDGFFDVCEIEPVRLENGHVGLNIHGDLCGESGSFRIDTEHTGEVMPKIDENFLNRIKDLERLYNTPLAIVKSGEEIAKVDRIDYHKTLKLYHSTTESKEIPRDDLEKADKLIVSESGDISRGLLYRLRKNKKLIFRGVAEVKDKGRREVEFKAPYSAVSINTELAKKHGFKALLQEHNGANGHSPYRPSYIDVRDVPKMDSNQPILIEQALEEPIILEETVVEPGKKVVTPNPPSKFSKRYALAGLALIGVLGLGLGVRQFAHSDAEERHVTNAIYANESGDPTQLTDAIASYQKAEKEKPFGVIFNRYDDNIRRLEAEIKTINKYGIQNKLSNEDLEKIRTQALDEYVTSLLDQMKFNPITPTKPETRRDFDVYEHDPRENPIGDLLVKAFNKKYRRGADKNNLVDTRGESPSLYFKIRKAEAEGQFEYSVIASKDNVPKNLARVDDRPKLDNGSPGQSQTDNSRSQSTQGVFVYPYRGAEESELSKRYNVPLTDFGKKLIKNGTRGDLSIIYRVPLIGNIKVTRVKNELFCLNNVDCKKDDSVNRLISYMQDPSIIQLADPVGEYELVMKLGGNQ